MLPAVAALLPLVVLAAAAPPVDRCVAARQATGYACQRAPTGVVLSADAGDLARLVAHATAGEERWHRYFDGAAAPYAIVESLGPDMAKGLHAAGLPVVLPWFSAEQYAAASSASVRAATEAQMKAHGMTDPAIVQAAVSQAVATWQGKHPPSDWTQKEAGAVPHELGHMWYIARYWPRASTDGAGHYGGPGPDWMDETAAILMEDDRLAEDRRRQFSAYYADRTPAGAEARRTLLDLSAFLHEDHPAKDLQGVIAARAAAAAGGSGSRVLILSPEEAKGHAQNALLFYLQARLFADYLIARSGTPTIFADIGAAFGRGDTIEHWLAARGGSFRLGTDIAKVQSDWTRWLEATQRNEYDNG